MKVKELIKELQDISPDGELEVNINGCDIYEINKIPAYYDGSLQRLTFENNGMTINNIIKAEYCGCGYKIVLNGIPIQELLEDSWTLPVEVSGYMNSASHKQEIESGRFKGYQYAIAYDKYPCASCINRPYGNGSKYSFRELFESCDKCYPANNFNYYEYDVDFFGEIEMEEPLQESAAENK